MQMNFIFANCSLSWMIWQTSYRLQLKWETMLLENQNETLSFLIVLTSWVLVIIWIYSLWRQFFIKSRCIICIGVYDIEHEMWHKRQNSIIIILIINSISTCHFISKSGLQHKKSFRSIRQSQLSDTRPGKFLFAIL